MTAAPLCTPPGPETPGPRRPTYVTVPDGLHSYDETVAELTGYLETMTMFDQSPPVDTGGVLGRQEVATAYHTRVRYIEYRILLREIEHRKDGTPFPAHWKSLRTGPIQSVLSALRHQMDLGSRKLSEAAYLLEARGDAGPAL